MVGRVWQNQQFEFPNSGSHVVIHLFDDMWIYQSVIIILDDTIWGALIY
jgi:hypothetical protein